MALFWKVLALAIIQGLTEFLPVSSSGHLVLAGRLLGLQHPGAMLEVFLHTGTLAAILVFYRRKLAGLGGDTLRGEPAALREVGRLLLSTLPALLLYVTARETLEAAFDRVDRVGPALCLTGLLLLSTRRADRKPAGRPGVDRRRDALWIGLAQALALVPGISRSGATISMARHRGIRPEAAAEFSFLMCIPLLAGATLLELGKAVAHGTNGIPCATLLAGAGVAGAVGYAALAVLVRTLRHDKFWRFGVYCLVLGLAAIAAAWL